MGPRPLVAVVGQTATGKSHLGIAIAARVGGEIVSCDSTAVYRGFDIGTDKVPEAERRGVPHHLVDVVAPTEVYTAARYAGDAAAMIAEVWRRGRVPILVGGSGLYYRALTRGLFPGPARDERLRGRLEAIAARRGVTFLHRALARVDRVSAGRILPRDLKRIVRALEVYLLTGSPLSAHFADTRPPLPDAALTAIALRLPPDALGDRLARRVDEQFARGVVDEVRGLLAAGVPRTAHAFTGLVYRQVLEHLDGARDEAATRALIVRENRRYARRQLIWFRKEPNLLWLSTPGESRETIDAAASAIVSRGTER